MKTVSIRDARRQFSDLIRAAEQGRSVHITRRGRAVAQLTPPQTAKDRALPDLTEFRASLRIKGDTMSKTVIKARRQERY